MAEDKTKCQTCSQNQAGGCASESCTLPEQNLLGKLNKIKRVIAVMSGKGGVGKSTITGLLAVGMNQLGYKVGVLDADITGPTIPRIFGVKGGNLKATDYGIIPSTTEQGIKIMSVNLLLPNEDEPVIWRGPVLAGMVKQFWGETDWRDLDYLLVDLPPGTGDVPLTVMQSLPVDGIVVVSSPQELVLMVVKKAVKMANKLNIPVLGLVENMSYASCPHCDEKLELFGVSHADEAAQQMDIPLLAALGWDPQLSRMMDEGKIEGYSSEEVTNLVKILADGQGL
ncbi:MAG: Mrp/NBP35 family ATP-binding protein [Syntrophomonadaceae bacterium]|nr:Mrp/NBP35 family ATP-binding protein [Syntrophomonadaceae bacterium]